MALIEPRARFRHRAQQRTAPLGSAISRAHGGHIIAVSLGGFASGPNLIPQAANVNVSTYARVEHGWRRVGAGAIRS
ncbi:DNA/RNA non-specific endonuclease [Salsipaludibacter albus]|uniref:DNA/RNA non-specific endonuclease n=1 Tax=Salsipaludibacter albus TaxID=2849650 RepID=UPI003B75BD17|nr:DNA/RNA non-specific endonuclease [Salsipaludibacter albus]